MADPVELAHGGYKNVEGSFLLPVGGLTTSVSLDIKTDTHTDTCTTCVLYFHVGSLLGQRLFILESDGRFKF